MGQEAGSDSMSTSSTRLDVYFEYTADRAAGFLQANAVVTDETIPVLFVPVATLNAPK